MKPRVAVFDFASCEGCQLQIANLEEQVGRLVEAVEVVSFREIMKEHSDEYDLAFVEGSIQRPMDEQRIRDIRSKAKVLVALGTCACTGCVNKLRNEWPIYEPKAEVYGDAKLGKSRLFDVKKTRAVTEVVPVDFSIRGCPVRREQVLYYIERLSWMPLHPPVDSRFHVTEKPIPVDERSLVLYDPHKCILCRRCDVLCREALGVDALGVVGKGSETVVATPRNVGFDQNGCIRCGQCVSACSCGSLEARSTTPQLAAELKSGKAMDIAVDSIVLASLVERAHFLKTMAPADVEMHVIGALKEAGFNRVLQYDQDVMESLKHDAQMNGQGKPRMLSWCKAAFNYAQRHIDGAELVRSEARSPWTLALERAEGNPMCLLTPCTALKGVEGFAHVLSAMDVDDLFKQLEIDIERAKPQGYDGAVAQAGRTHPGYAPARLPFEAKVCSLRISKDLQAKLHQTGGSHVEIFPCMNRCLSGGGNFPTVEVEVIDARTRWLESLWGVGP